VEVAQATKHLENLEHELVLCDLPTFAPKLLPAVDAESSAPRQADEP
jgi:hypothetical protein